MPETHEVTNQAPPLTGHDAADDPVLIEGVRREGAEWHLDDLHRFGRVAGSEEARTWADQANRHEPELRTHDRYGHRIDEVDFHPAYHSLMTATVGAGAAGSAWADERPGAHVARASTFMVATMMEQGHMCPVSMTYAVVPALRRAPDLAKVYEPLLTSSVYDPGLRAPAGKRGLLAGMGMTEKQGGTDVRANTTSAVEQADGTWRLRGHKWFTSAPMNDLFLVLAQAPAGLSCFLVPRVLPDGSRNTFRIQRLKDKLGNRSNASSEPEFDDTVAWLVGDEGKGVRTIIDMVTMTRLDCVLGSAGHIRESLAQAVHHTRHRSVFGAKLVDQPLMRNVLADLGLESEAATTLGLRLAGAADRAQRGDAGSGRSCGWRRPSPSTGCASGSRPSSRKPWNALAATVMTRRQECRASTARLRSTASGRAPETSTPSTCCGRWPVSPSPSRPSSRRSRRRPVPTAAWTRPGGSSRANSSSPRTPPARPPRHRAGCSGAAGLASRTARTGPRRRRVLRVAPGRGPGPGLRDAPAGHGLRGAAGAHAGLRGGGVSG